MIYYACKESFKATPCTTLSWSDMLAAWYGVVW